MEPGALAKTTVDHSAKCNTTLVEDDKHTKCFNEWFVNDYNNGWQYNLYFYTNDSSLPTEGQYTLQISNGKIQRNNQVLGN